MSEIGREAADVLHESLHSDPALDFAEAVVRNVTASRAGLEVGSGRESSAADTVVRLLIGVESPAAIGEELTRDPPLLAALFQNVDLLFLRGDGRAERVSAAVMHALDSASEKP